MNNSTTNITSDPNKIGPGSWFLLHLMAKYATTPVLKEAFIYNLDLLRTNFTCAKCRQHINQYLDEHPIRNYYYLKDNQGNDIGMFRYMWEFHNVVNLRLNKPHVSWQEAINNFTNLTSAICTGSCSGEHSPVSPIKTTTTMVRPISRIPVSPRNTRIFNRGITPIRYSNN
jgi:hypothetical protein